MAAGTREVGGNRGSEAGAATDPGMAGEVREFPQSGCVEGKIPIPEQVLSDTVYDSEVNCGDKKMSATEGAGREATAGGPAVVELERGEVLPIGQVRYKQVVVNATNLAVTDVIWPGVDSLYFDSKLQAHVMQIHIWSNTLSKWLKIVPEYYLDKDALVVTLEQLSEIGVYEARGVPKLDAIELVLGGM